DYYCSSWESNLNLIF
nr:immunoglobulin light chain junction region [Macaca mulatta]